MPHCLQQSVNNYHYSIGRPLLTIIIHCYGEWDVPNVLNCAVLCIYVYTLTYAPSKRAIQESTTMCDLSKYCLHVFALANIDYITFQCASCLEDL